MGIGEFQMQPQLCLVVQDDGMGTQQASVLIFDLAHILFDQAMLV